MCVSFWPTTFTKTITGTWEVLVEGRLNHVLWYQNNVGDGVLAPSSGLANVFFELAVGQAMAGVDWRQFYAAQMRANSIEPATVQEECTHRQAGHPKRSLTDILSQSKELIAGNGNCLIIPLQGLWQSIRLLNTTDVPNLLRDVSEALIEPEPASKEATWSLEKFGYSGGGLVFLQFSIYDIVIAENAASLPSALAQIDPNKRPRVNDAVFSTLEKWYQCPVAVCCFNNAESGMGKPLAFAFEPIFPENIVVYTLDAHDGQPPNPSALVNLDHSVFVGSYLTDPSMCAEVEYADDIPDHLRPYILKHVMGVQVFDKKYENGDIVFSASDVRDGHFEGLRSLPPYAPNGVPRLGHRIQRFAKYNNLFEADGPPRSGWDW